MDLKKGDLIALYIFPACTAKKFTQRNIAAMLNREILSPQKFHVLQYKQEKYTMQLNLLSLNPFLIHKCGGGADRGPEAEGGG
jgi:hypothetical protein